MGAYSRHEPFLHAAELQVVRCREFESPTPEQKYHRPTLKKRFYGAQLSHGDEVKRRLALAALATPGALDRLRARPSFQAFERQLATF